MLQVQFPSGEVQLRSTDDPGTLQWQAIKQN